MKLPDSSKELTKLAIKLIEICKSSQGQRASAYRQYGQWIETGRANGGLGIANMLYSHIARLQSHLFSPTDLRFNIDFENHYDKLTLLKASMGARVLSREWERQNIDMTFGEGVGEALAYGACIQKLIVKEDVFEGKKVFSNVTSRLVLPWQFGVYNETVNGLGDQEAVCETVYLNEHEVWRRIAHLPDAEGLYKRIMSITTKDGGVSAPSNFMHNVLSTAVLDVSLQNATQPQPGGIVQLSNDPNYATLGPQVTAGLIPMHELWVHDDEKNDYVTIQLIEPDILVAPLLKKTNLFCPNTLPYGLTQPNTVSGYFWGRSEITDLMMLQEQLSTQLDDIKRLMGMQFDKLLWFVGEDGITDEKYAQFRAAGYGSSTTPGASVEDLTPKIPEHAIEYLGVIESLMDKVSGFSNILSGRGEAGVRAGNHADTLMRTASPRLRDRALLVERQCASLADSCLAVMEAKDAKAYWTDPDSGADSEFLLKQLPDDRRVCVDSHSSSPIYHDDHQQIVAFLVKSQIIDGETAIEMLDIPNKDMIITRLREKEKAKEALIAAHPELLTQGAHHGAKK